MLKIIFVSLATLLSFGLAILGIINLNKPLESYVYQSFVSLPEVNYMFILVGLIGVLLGQGDQNYSKVIVA
ncbi:TPA: hypothetical protein NVL56_001098 [Enterobacter hormaechei subsp. xiangfangensis]|nr:hypothetical protein [Enterobacter hormaechei subsp. xiangfangensis]